MIRDDIIAEALRRAHGDIAAAEKGGRRGGEN